MRDKFCSESECDSTATVRGMCNMHYRRAFKAGKLEPVLGLPVALRLDRKSKIDYKTGCVEWSGMKNKYGYGRIGVGGNTSLTTHRVVWEEVYGPIPDGMCVLHHCDNRACINIAHLFLGTIADNHADMDAKGRRNSPKGAQHPRAKLTEDQILQIRRDQRTLREIAPDYGITFSYVRRIKIAESWKHI